MNNELKTIVLEPSTNTHIIKEIVANTVEVTQPLKEDPSIRSITTYDKGVITHGEHGAIVIGGEDKVEHWTKGPQQEPSPFSGEMFAAQD